jgi:hypothetical protein
MPLEKGSSQETISKNISEMEKSGHSHEQSVAAALHEAKDSKAIKMIGDSLRTARGRETRTPRNHRAFRRVQIREE